MFGFKALVWDPEARQVLSPASPIVWTDGMAEAKCYEGQSRYFPNQPPAARFESHAAPKEGCTCGIYAALTLDVIDDYVTKTGLRALVPRLFTGLLYATGKIICCDLGWRAEQAEIIAVSTVPGRNYAAWWGVTEAAETLGVPFIPAPMQLGVGVELGYEWQWPPADRRQEGTG
jgi:hypothetical protein